MSSKNPLLNLKFSVLDQIAVSLATDKSSLANGYTSVYEYYFLPLRDKHINILELGVAEDAKSLKLWSQYFPNAHIFGIDNKTICSNYQIDRVQIFIGDLLDNSFMKNTLDSIGMNFNIIIDDSSHSQPQTSHSLNQLWPYLHSGGVYIVEDLHTSYLSSFGMGYRQPGTIIEELKGLVDTLHVSTYKETPKSAVYKLLGGNCRQEPLNQFEQYLRSIHFYQGICFLFKE